MKFACIGEITRAADRVALQPARLEHPARAELVLRVLEDAAERALVRRLRRLAPRDQLGDRRLDLVGRPRLEPVLDLGDDLAVPELGVAVGEAELGRRQPAGAVGR